MDYNNSPRWFRPLGSRDEADLKKAGHKYCYEKAIYVVMMTFPVVQ